MTKEGREGNGKKEEERREGASKNNERLLSTGKTRPAADPAAKNRLSQPRKEDRKTKLHKGTSR